MAALTRRRIRLVRTKGGSQADSNSNVSCLDRCQCVMRGRSLSTAHLARNGRPSAMLVSREDGRACSEGHAVGRKAARRGRTPEPRHHGCRPRRLIHPMPPRTGPSSVRPCTMGLSAQRPLPAEMAVSESHRGATLGLQILTTSARRSAAQEGRRVDVHGDDLAPLGASIRRS
jgi:hypothetical protein